MIQNLYSEVCLYYDCSCFAGITSTVSAVFSCSLVPHEVWSPTIAILIRRKNKVTAILSLVLVSTVQFIFCRALFQSSCISQTSSVNTNLLKVLYVLWLHRQLYMATLLVTLQRLSFIKPQIKKFKLSAIQNVMLGRAGLIPDLIVKNESNRVCMVVEVTSPSTRDGDIEYKPKR